MPIKRYVNFTQTELDNINIALNRGLVIQADQNGNYPKDFLDRVMAADHGLDQVNVDLVNSKPVLEIMEPSIGEILQDVFVLSPYHFNFDGLVSGGEKYLKYNNKPFIISPADSVLISINYQDDNVIPPGPSGWLNFYVNDDPVYTWGLAYYQNYDRSAPAFLIRKDDRLKVSAEYAGNGVQPLSPTVTLFFAMANNPGTGRLEF